MALVMTKAGSNLILKAGTLNTGPASPLRVELYTAGPDPILATSVLGDFTLASGSGYASQNLTPASWSFNTAADPVVASHAELTFTFSAAHSAIVGYLVLDANDVLIWGEKFGSSKTITQNGDQVRIIPRLTGGNS